MELRTSALAAGRLYMTPSFWRGRRVLLTGHTGFKGAWMAAMLDRFGAEVAGLSLKPETEPALIDFLRPKLSIQEQLSDIRDVAAVAQAVQRFRPEIVIHMAAQAQVLRGYQSPAETFSTNVLGTACVLDELRDQRELSAVLVITSDKVYQNQDDGRALTEADPLGGTDPYSASKAACEVLVQSYYHSYFKDKSVPVATARAGNVLGGGDFASNRLVPDIFRSVRKGPPLTLRYPHAVRPWQHVLDCTVGYLSFIERLQSKEHHDVLTLNFAPASDNVMTVAEIADKMCAALGGAHAYQVENPTFPEKHTLRLSAALARKALGWHPLLSMQQVLSWTTAWYGDYASGTDPATLVQNQISVYLEQHALTRRDCRSSVS